MSLNDSITRLATNTVTVRRRVEGTFVNGVYVLGAASTFTCLVVVQPAYNLNRVVGGADLSARVDNEKVADVRVVYTTTELKTRTPTTDPDVVTDLEGAEWTVTRVERWDLTGKVHFRCIISKQTEGAS